MGNRCFAEAAGQDSKSFSGGDGGGTVGPKCGPNTCDVGEVCCNENCGICASPDDFCIQEYCCPTPSDDVLCDADYSPVVCADGCEYSNSCFAEAAGQEVGSCGDVVGTECGSNTCDPGEYCCNESCGTCAPLGGFCTQEYCCPTPSEDTVCFEIYAPVVCKDGCEYDNSCFAEAAGQTSCEEVVRAECGPNTCEIGEVCCNESCGICTRPGGFCTKQFCGEEEEENDDGERCGSKTCGSDERCVFDRCCCSGQSLSETLQCLLGCSGN